MSTKEVKILLIRLAGTIIVAFVVFFFLCPRQETSRNDQLELGDYYPPETRFQEYRPGASSTWDDTSDLFYSGQRYDYFNEGKSNDLVEELFDKYGIASVALGYEEFGSNYPTLALECAVRVEYENGRTICITDEILEEEVFK